jgi:hypothetical protein
MTTDAYLDAKHAFEKIDSEVKAIGKLIADVGSALMHRPDRFIFSNVPTGLPGTIALNQHTPSANGAAWLSADAIQQKLVRWHQTRDEMMAKWNSVPQERRGNLVSPGGGVQGRDYR